MLGNFRQCRPPPNTDGGGALKEGRYYWPMRCVICRKRRQSSSLPDVKKSGTGYKRGGKNKQRYAAGGLSSLLHLFAEITSWFWISTSRRWTTRPSSRRKPTSWQASWVRRRLWGRAELMRRTPRDSRSFIQSDCEATTRIFSKDTELRSLPCVCYLKGSNSFLWLWHRNKWHTHNICIKDPKWNV